MAITDPTQFFGGMAQTSMDIASRLPSRKSFDPSRFSNLGAQSSGATTPYSGPKYVSPELSKIGTLTTDYGGKTKWEKFHPGIDLAGAYGSPIPAFSSGTVTEVVGGKKKGDKGFGNTVVIIDSSGKRWRYSHLKQSFVEVGAKVGKGTVIGSQGNTGSVYSLTRTDPQAGTHLDLRIYDAAKKYYSPYQAIRQAT